MFSMYSCPKSGAIYSGMQFSDFLLHWLTVGSKTRWDSHTWYGYGVNVRKHIIPYLGHYRLYELSAPLCDQLYIRLRFSGLSDTTIRYVHRTISAALNYACSPNILKQNPAQAKMTRFKRSSFQATTYTPDEMAMLMNHSMGSQWECILLLTGMYGLRRSEALGLKWSHIDVTHRRIHIVEQLASPLVQRETGKLAKQLKTENSVRDLYITDYALQIFLHQQQRQIQAIETSPKDNPFVDHGYVLFMPNGKYWDGTHLAREFHKISDCAGLDRARIHDLRHSTASNIYELTGDFLAVAKILGHSLKGLSLSLDRSIPSNSVTAEYITIRPHKTDNIIKIYHADIEQRQAQLGKRIRIISI